MSDDEAKTSSRPKGGDAPSKRADIAPVQIDAPPGAPVVAAPAVEGPAHLRLPEEWGNATGHGRAERVRMSTSNGEVPGPSFDGDHRAASRLHGWGRADRIPRPISREDYEAAIKAAKRAPEGKRSPQPHPGANFAPLNG
jgi:hypothetical protein